MADALKQKFDAAVEEVKTAGEWSKAIPNDRRLLCYAMFKQVNQGDVTGTQPWAVQFEARSKWDAWNNVKGMSKNDAMVSSSIYSVTRLFYLSNISLIL